MAEPPRIPEPSDHGMLDVGDGNHVYWETVGTGRPVLFVHGGPGTGCTPNMRNAVDLRSYQLVLFDQRNCGRSTPHASDPAADMRHNTTHHLIRDMEQLREHLGIDRWMLWGGSWGTTLALAYAQRHAERVTHIFLSAITTSRPSETDWLYRGARLFFPEAWAMFRDHVRDDTVRDDDVLRAYAERMEHPDREVRLAATNAWMDWEDTVLSLEPSARPNMFSDRPEDAAIALVRICAHYAAHHAWLRDNEIIDNAHKLRGIPGVLVHGRQDLSCPATTAYELAQAWPDAELHIVDDAGHQGSASKTAVIRAAAKGFGR